MYQVQGVKKCPAQILWYILNILSKIQPEFNKKNESNILKLLNPNVSFNK